MNKINVQIILEIKKTLTGALKYESIKVLSQE